MSIASSVSDHPPMQRSLSDLQSSASCLIHNFLHLVLGLLAGFCNRPAQDLVPAQYTPVDLLSPGGPSGGPGSPSGGPGSLPGSPGSPPSGPGGPPLPPKPLFRSLLRSLRPPKPLYALWLPPLDDPESEHHPPPLPP
ncbi:hypothetical protein GYMLUDRAFT_236328 [Collybiopsis luxurians FD-317 M1]|nr:hypothetical protein GYMLUDRAFT_236328 [Collybiopsis luxurians FD-317 M1]